MTPKSQCSGAPENSELTLPVSGYITSLFFRAFMRDATTEYVESLLPRISYSL